MKFLSRLRNKIWESAPLFYIFGLINSVIVFFLLRQFLPEWTDFSVLIIVIISGIIGDYYIRKWYIKKNKKE
ncbi:MAG: hypothetical protein B6D37_07765 [Sphingobacteriales bacterium UTBCD1]|jgi:positive regulator of sigma E activity|nr:MAG: hypothetical protein B6D37_07765 [Sphingobacteriales bacterium UTBCD1]